MRKVDVTIKKQQVVKELLLRGAGEETDLDKCMHYLHTFYPDYTPNATTVFKEIVAQALFLEGYIEEDIALVMSIPVGIIKGMLIYPQPVTRLIKAYEVFGISEIEAKKKILGTKTPIMYTF